jgi:hypothetical protein
LGDTVGLAREGEQNDGPWESSFVIGQSVRALVVKKDDSGAFLNIKTSATANEKADFMLLKSYFRESQLLQKTRTYLCVSLANNLQTERSCRNFQLDQL